MVPWEWMRDVKRHRLCEIDGIVDTMEQDEVEGEMEF
jgi:hypothetical protein